MSFYLKLHTNWVKISSEKCFKSIFSITWRDIRFLFSSHYPELMLVDLNWEAVCANFFFFTCVLNSLHVFLLPLVFSSTAAVEFCFCDNVRLIRHVITNHVHCAELPALWLYADRNCELCQSASYLKHGFEWILEESHFFRVSNSNSKYDRAFGVITYFLFWVVLIFLKFQSKQNSNLLYKSP